MHGIAFPSTVHENVKQSTEDGARTGNSAWKVKVVCIDSVVASSLTLRLFKRGATPTLLDE